MEPTLSSDWRVAARRRGATLRLLREAQKMTQATLAVLAETSQQTVDRLERGDVRESAALERISKIIGYEPGMVVVPDAIADVWHGVRSIEDLSPEERFDAERPSVEMLQGLIRSREIREQHQAFKASAGHIPVFVSSDFVRPVTEILCPDPLIDVAGGYGVLLDSSDMEPAFEPGDTLLIHPFLPPRAGSDVFYRDMDGKHLLRRLVRTDIGSDMVRTWRSDEPEPVKRTTWPIRHVVVGKFVRG